MKEAREIVEAYLRLKETGETAVLATVVRTRGPAYRRAGARLLIREDGSYTGFISGGCLEGDLFERAKEVRREGLPLCVTYDTSSSMDLLVGTGLGCGGIVDILLERVDGRNPPPYLETLAGWVGERRTGILATVFQVEGEPGLSVGYRGCLPGEMAEPLSAEAERALENKTSRTRRLDLPGGSAEILFEYIHPPISLMVFGAANDAQPLVKFASALGWGVTVVDGRQELARPGRFPEADAVLCVHPQDVAEQVGFGGVDAVVVMTHNYLHDRAIAEAALASEVRYIGIMGSLRRRDALFEELRKKGLMEEGELPDRIHSPVGLDLGAEEPEEVALAIVAEIQAFLRGRRAEPLRDKAGSIHAPSRSPNVA